MSPALLPPAPLSRTRRWHRAALLTALLWTLPAAAQELRVQPVPFSAWLNFHAGADVGKGLPIWMESVQRSVQSDAAPQRTSFRLRLRRLGQLNNEVQLRLFFEDRPASGPLVTGWTETGAKMYESGPLGAGTGLPSSQSLNIPVAQLDYLDIEVPGDGNTLRGAFISTLQNYQGRRALDFEQPPAVDDPFGNLSLTGPAGDDFYLFGRIKAGIDVETLTLNESTPTSLVEIELDKVPLIAVVSFEVLNVNPLYPPHLTVNEHPLGRVALRLPDLADPGFQGTVRSLDPDMSFTYTGWLPCQQIVQGSDLRAGLNKLVFELSRQSGPIAVRAIKIELKHRWRNLDYKLAP